VRDGSLWFIPVPFDVDGVPADLVKALKAAAPAWDRWCELPPSHQREHVDAIEEAKKPETRARRIDSAVRMIVARAPES
jgi:uncharacterized protein YdeI (YjbR/CyaY-like superfamily)